MWIPPSQVVMLGAGMNMNIHTRAWRLPVPPGVRWAMSLPCLAATWHDRLSRFKHMCAALCVVLRVMRIRPQVLSDAVAVHELTQGLGQ